MRAALALLVGILALGVAPVSSAAPSATPAPSASSAPSAADKITWSVTPASNGAPDKRAWIELDLDPGTKAEQQAAVRNLSATSVTFSIVAADGYFTDKGRFNMLSSDQKSVDAGTWISAPGSITVEPGGTGIVPFTVTVPQNATPGDHAAGIAASVRSANQTPGGSSVGVESRIGFRVMTRVKGDLTPALSIENVASDYRLSWNPFEPGSLSLVADVVNTGNVRLLLGGSANAQGASVPLTPADGVQQELLPGDRRSVSVQLDSIWPLFGVGADLTVAPTVAAPEGQEATMAPITQSLTVAAVPLPQLLVLLGIALILLALFAGRRRSRRHVAALVQQAKEEGLREGARSSGSEGADAHDADLGDTTPESPRAEGVKPEGS
ncbi:MULTISPECIES: WxL protein peptidoglycan domain-containing protein [unclassified Rathayibacter]|uniref:WxL protein peptidoglycan domain-containing protein n=1 Tax=unclassified Rathayibacter TaxID=2609250 RepID=UPI00188B3E97|nr:MULTISPECIES: DUF916 domain-containing protein [unclassified Rathayibacter]MBF4461197.1 DUF916 domain-containing protein [Rathayibacter sp. VKM Ac-2879]MBF4502608.1 DUF916 domain-containing protein [Rathayibacter sp. VKM Ac-2878]